MYDKIRSTYKVQCFSLSLLIIYIIIGFYWYFSDRKTNILCKNDADEENCKRSMNIIINIFLIFNIPGCVLLSFASAQGYLYLIIAWLVIAMLQIPTSFFASLWFLCWHQLMDPGPALIFAGVVLSYGCLLLVSWVFVYNLVLTIQYSRQQRRVTALVLVIHRI